jgi:signal transduction histidine kinase
MILDGDETQKQLIQIVEKQSVQIRELNEELNDLKHQIIFAEKLSTMGKLSAGIAHEIKNPLNFIKNFAELSLEYLQEINEISRHLNQEESANQIQDLIDDTSGNVKKILHHESRITNIVASMLLHARGGSGDFEPTNINKVIKDFVNLAFHGMRAAKNPINIDIQLNLDESIPLVPLKEEEFSRVILNICNNAFDAIRENINKNSSDHTEMSKSPLLKVSSVCFEDFVHIVIEYNGPGIPKENLDKIFQPFFTTKKKSQGTGLGLSISKNIIESHKGELYIDSEEGQFTRFTILIPTQNKR